MIARYAVEVYADLVDADKDQIVRGVLWRSYKAYDPDFPPNVFIAWRYAISLALCPRSNNNNTLCVIWLHDIVSHSVLPKALFTVVNITSNNNTND